MAKIWNGHIPVNMGPMEAPSSVPDSPQPQDTTSKLSEHFDFCYYGKLHTDSDRARVSENLNANPRLAKKFSSVIIHFTC